jgi:hypothetical protein
MFGGCHDSSLVVTVTLDIDDGVNEVFECSRTGDITVFGDVADEN